MQLMAGGAVGAWVECPRRWAPAPGQYLAAASFENRSDPLAHPLFPTAYSEQGFLAGPPFPPDWLPGTRLQLSGPLGRGFHVPVRPARLALAAFGSDLARLLPLAEQALRQEAAVAVFSDAPLPGLPLSIEAYPLASLPEALTWAVFLALDLPLESLPGLRTRLALAPGERLPCAAEALIFTPMPCRGLAECGACAVPARRGWKLACKDGPVFDLADLEW